MKYDGFTTRDYLQWRGDIPFSLDPFNMIDNLILSEICYLSFKDIVPQNKERTHLTLRECYESGKVVAINDGVEFREERMEIFTLAALSRRFKDVEVCNYIDRIETQRSMQFAVMEFRLDHLNSYIAFRGTDNTILGWKEDFMLSFTKIPAQVAGAKYLEEVIPNLTLRHYFIGGHSKGANLAVYASASLSARKQEHIEYVYDNDGPGICPDVMDPSIVEPIRDRVIMIKPVYCVVGRLFDMKFPNEYIVKSSRSGTEEHDIGSWLLKTPHDLLTSQQHDPGSTWMAKVFNEWCFKLKEEDRKAFVDEFFEGLKAGGAEDFDQLEANHYEGVLKALLKASPQAKDAGLLLPKTAMQIGMKMVGDSFNEGLSKISDHEKIQKIKQKKEVLKNRKESDAVFKTIE